MGAGHHSWDGFVVAIHGIWLPCPRRCPPPEHHRCRVPPAGLPVAEEGHRPVTVHGMKNRSLFMGRLGVSSGYTSLDVSVYYPYRSFLTSMRNVKVNNGHQIWDEDWVTFHGTLDPRDLIGGQGSCPRTHIAAVRLARGPACFWASSGPGRRLCLLLAGRQKTSRDPAPS